MPSTRIGYTALPTPASTVFDVPYTASPPISASPSRQINAIQDDFVERGPYEKFPGKGRRLRAIWGSIQDIARNNNGLLLVAASQVFLSLMNLAVKILNEIDPPVSTLEVCLFMHHVSSI